MDIAEILRHILIVLVAAKVAAEIAERLGIPVVVGEIVAGMAIGPSLLNAVGSGDEVLRVLGELGVILLLLDVGLEMDLRELSRVGRTSLQVAVIGVVAPMALGFGLLRIMGEDVNTSLFVGAALTATSVGITARVFGDLKALATKEARIVLGAAVADDVMGLVVLTVVVRLLTEGSVSVISVGGIVAAAIGFLGLGGLLGLRAAPPLFTTIERLSRSPGTLVALALAFALAFAELADLARLAPIVGAFVAGVALAEAPPATRIRRELSSVGHLFIPVFFLQIGIDADVGSFLQVSVLRDAALLLTVAAAGKLLSALGALRGPGDTALIGLGMLPRGEVGLIFATLGLQQGVLDGDLYAAMLLVVLVTTLATPPLLAARYARLRRRAAPPAAPPDTTPPQGGWLRVTRDEVDLAAIPPPHLARALALDAAVALAQRRPTQVLLDWLASNSAPVDRLDEATTAKLLDVVEFGTARSWRVLQTTGALDALWPDVARMLAQRSNDPFHLDPLQTLRFETLERRRRLDAADPLARAIDGLAHPDRLVLAAFLAELLDDVTDAGPATELALQPLALLRSDREAVRDLVADRDLLWSAARQPGALEERAVLELAAHLATPEQACTLHALSALRENDRARWERQRLDTLHELIQQVLGGSELGGPAARSLVEARRGRALSRVDRHSGTATRLATAPRSYVLRTDTDRLTAHADLVEAAGRRMSVAVAGAGPHHWWVDIAYVDQPGLLAAVTRALMDADLPVLEAVAARWDDGAVVDSFRVAAGARPDPDSLAAAVVEVLVAPMSVPGLPDAEVTFDHRASPWHSICEVTATDRPGVLHTLAVALAAAKVDVRSAEATSHEGLVIDRFEVVDSNGAKLGAEDEARVIALIHEGVDIRRRRRPRLAPAGRR